jgi:hypothetical protein
MNSVVQLFTMCGTFAPIEPRSSSGSPLPPAATESSRPQDIDAVIVAVWDTCIAGSRWTLARQADIYLEKPMFAPMEYPESSRRCQNNGSSGGQQQRHALREAGRFVDSGARTVNMVRTLWNANRLPPLQAHACPDGMRGRAPPLEKPEGLGGTCAAAYYRYGISITNPTSTSCS